MTTTNTWTGNDGTTAFEDGGNWTAGEPNAGQDVVITKAHAVVATTTDQINDLASSLTLGATDTFSVEYSANVYIYNGITNSGTFVLGAFADLTIGGKLVLNSGSSTQIGDSKDQDDSAILNINSNIKISGPGHLYFANAYDPIFSTSATNTPFKIENTNSTIEGACSFGSKLQLQNDSGATIEADIAESAMDIKTGNTIVNAGLMEATAGGGLLLEDSVTNASTGVILASGANSYVEFDKNATVSGGDLRTTNGGLLVVEDGNVNFQNLAIDGSLQILSGATFAGAITVGGEVTDDSTLSVRGFTTLTAAAGDITISEGYNIVAVSTGGTLQNHILIHGDGTIGDGMLVLDNYGTIEANTGNIDVELDTASDGTSVNEASGTLEAVGGDELTIFTNDVNNGSSFTNYGSVIANGGTVTIGTNAALSFSNAGLVEAIGGGSIDIAESATSNIAGGILSLGTWAVGEDSALSFADAFTSDAATLSLEGSGVIYDGTQTLQNALTDISGELTILEANYTTTNTLSLEGVLQTNAGTFTSGLITGAAGSTIEGSDIIASNIQTAGTVSVENLFLTLTGNDSFSGTLSGLGGITFANDTVTLLDGVSIGTDIGLSAATLSIATSGGNPLVDTNDVSETGSTISFTGNQSLTLAGTTALNGGEVTGTGLLSITGAATSTGFTIDTGAGLEVSGGGTLALQSGTFTNNGGLSAYGTGSTVTFGGTAKLANISGGTLTGGAFDALAGGTMTLTGGVVTVDAASIYVGNGAVFQTGSGTKFTTLQKSLKTIAAGGTLGIVGGTYTTSNAIALNGTLQISSPPGTSAAVFSSGLITGSASSTIVGGYQGGTIISSITDAGTVTKGLGNLIFTGAKDTFSGAFQSTNNLGYIEFSAGTDILAAGASLSDYSTILNGATVQLGASITDNGNFQIDSGTLSLRSSAYTFTVNGVKNGLSYFSGGTVLGPGTLAVNTASTLSGLTVSGGAKLSNAGAMSIDGGLTLSKGTLVNQTAGIVQFADGGSIGLAAGATGIITNSGLIEKIADTATSTISGTLTNSGTVLAGAGTLEITGAVRGTGTLAIAGGTLQLDAGPASTQGTVFQAPGTLALNTIGRDASAISGFGPRDTLDLLTLSGGSVKSFTEASNGTQGTLVVTNGTRTDTLTLLGSYTAAGFGYGSDGANGTTITYQPAAEEAVKKAAVVQSAVAGHASTATPATDATPSPAPSWENLFASSGSSGDAAHARSTSFDTSGFGRALFDAAFDQGGLTDSKHDLHAAALHPLLSIGHGDQGAVMSGEARHHSMAG